MREEVQPDLPLRQLSDRQTDAGANATATADADANDHNNQAGQTDANFPTVREAKTDTAAVDNDDNKAAATDTVAVGYWPSGPAPAGDVCHWTAGAAQRT